MKLSYLLSLAAFVFIASGAWAQQEIKKNAEPQRLYHVILLKWKTGVDTVQIGEIVSLWHNLAADVAGFDWFEINRVEHSFYDHVVVLGFSDVSAFRSYQSHKYHDAINEIGQDVVSEFSVFSYWRQTVTGRYR